MVSKLYKIISLWENNCNYPLKGLRVVPEKTLSVSNLKPSISHQLCPTLSWNSRKFEENQVCVLFLRYHLWRCFKYHCVYHYVKCSCILLTLLTRFPMQNSVDSTQVQCQQHQEREKFHINRADNQMSLTPHSSYRDLEALIPSPVTVGCLGESLSDAWAIPMSARFWETCVSWPQSQDLVAFHSPRREWIT